MPQVQPLERRSMFSTYVPDLGLGSGGLLTALSSYNFVEARGDKIIAGGPFTPRDGLTVTRLWADGTPDRTFGDQGVARVRAGFTGVSAMGPGFFASGGGGQRQTTDVRFTRLDADGHAVDGYGDDGVATVNLPIAVPGRPTYNASISLMAADSLGRLVFAGTVIERVGKAKGVYETYAYVGRLTASGQLDRSFGRRGFVKVEGDAIVFLDVDTAGRALFQASADYARQSPQRLTTAGGADAKYNRQVRSVFDGLEPLSYGYGYAADALDGDRLLVRSFRTGAVETTTARPRLVRLDSTGRADATFGDAGGIIVAKRGIEIDRVLLAPDGTIFASASRDGNSLRSEGLLVHYAADGRLLSRSDFHASSEYGNSLAAVDSIGRVLVRTGETALSRLTTLDLQPAAVSAGVLRVFGTAGDDTIGVSRRGETIRVFAAGRSFKTAAAGITSIKIEPFSARDTVTVSVDLDTNIACEDGRDTLTTAGGDDTFGTTGYFDNEEGSIIRTGDGDDFVNGSDGDDRIEMGDGDKSLYTNDGDDTIIAGTGDIRLYGNGGSNHVTLAGGGGEIGFTDSDDEITITGGGDYKIDAGAGRDRVRAGSGNDTIYVSGEATVDGGAGEDTIQRNYEDNYVRNDVAVFVHGGPGNDSIYFVDALRAVTLFGDGGNDDLTGGYGRDLLDGGDGRDRLFGNDAADTLRGGAGDDLLWGDDEYATSLTGGRDLLDGGPGVDTLRGGPGRDLAVDDPDDRRLDTLVLI